MLIFSASLFFGTGMLGQTWAHWNIRRGGCHCGVFPSSQRSTLQDVPFPTHSVHCSCPDEQWSVLGPSFQGFDMTGPFSWRLIDWFQRVNGELWLPELTLHTLSCLKIAESKSNLKSAKSITRFCVSTGRLAADLWLALFLLASFISILKACWFQHEINEKLQSLV